MGITITLTASPELMQILQGIAEGLTAQATPKKPRKLEKSPGEPVEEAGSPELDFGANDNGVSKEPEPAAAGGKVISIEQVRAAVQTKSQSGKREAVKSLLTKFGVERVTALDPEKLAPFLKEVNSL